MWIIKDTILFLNIVNSPFLNQQLCNSPWTNLSYNPVPGSSIVIVASPQIIWIYKLIRQIPWL